ncbi:Uma2 family endonuclease [Aquisphaera insulae]|uniref:Uma2 family endonuclease n=1 Tax=Aquisphaera insulae TaxID=2712864 RepID=UPI0013EE26D7|nr:Uma2 family endonuclease [Aquisphaera insulae]
MSTRIARPLPTEIVYPDSDGEPMADNNLQYQWIVTITGNLELIFLDDPDVFVVGNMLWYPIEGDNKTRIAPDTMVAFGRPKGYRGSYMQWIENGIAPQVVFEVLSPGNHGPEMARKRDAYERFGVEEYYVYDPDDDILTGWLRRGDRLVAIPDTEGWVSPRLGIRFDTTTHPMTIYGPDGKRFLTMTELGLRAGQVDAAVEQRDAAIEQRDAAVEQRDAAVRERDLLLAKLRALGIEP